MRLFRGVGGSEGRLVAIGHFGINGHYLIVFVTVLWKPKTMFPTHKAKNSHSLPTGRRSFFDDGFIIRLLVSVNKVRVTIFGRTKLGNLF